MKSVIILLLVAGVARADDRATAERYFRAGAKAYAAQSFEAAAAQFEEAYRALALPEIAFSTAQAYRKLYRVDPRPAYVKRAVELYRVYLDKVKKGGRVGDAADSLGEMERELSRLGGAKVEPLPTVERTRIGVHVSVTGEATAAMREIGDISDDALAGVTTQLDGKPIEPFALIDVAEGDHAISVTAPGYFPVEKKQRAVRGATALVEVELAPKPASIRVKTESGARIAIDGRGVLAPAFELAAGTHLLAITRSGREPYTKELTVTRGQALTLAAPLAKTAKRKAVPYVLGGAGALAALSLGAAIAAVVYDGRASELEDELHAGNAPPSSGDAFDHAVARRDDYKTGAYVLGGAALIAGTVGVILYAFDSPTSESIRVAPAASPSSAGVTASGRF